jgi:iron complex transport system ATP-binding protein
MLAARALTVSYGDRPVLAGIDLDLRPGECVGLIGPNGAGKSTLIRALAGLERHRGLISLDDRPLESWSPRERARRIGYLAQKRAVAWPLRVDELVGLGRLPHRGPFAVETAADRRAVARALTLAGVADLSARRADHLSGGELASVLIARLIAQEAAVVLADEPAAGLDPAHQLTTMGVFARLARARHAVLVSLHDLTLAARWCDRLVLVDAGVVVADGPPESVLTEQRLVETYGIEARIDRDAGGLIVVPLRRVIEPRPEAGP